MKETEQLRKLLESVDTQLSETDANVEQIMQRTLQQLIAISGDKGVALDQMMEWVNTRAEEFFG